MEAKKCDRCGDFYGYDDVFTAPSILKNADGRWPETSYCRMELFRWPSKTHYVIDLCPKCGEQLYNWLNGAKEDTEPSEKDGRCCEKGLYEDNTDKHCESCKWHRIDVASGELLHKCEVMMTEIQNPNTMTCPNWEEA